MRNTFVSIAILLGGTGLNAGILLTVGPVVPGSTPGWGFTLTNDTGVAVVTQAVMDGLPAGLTFTDLISTSFVPIGNDGPFAQPSWSQPFNFTLGEGLGYVTGPSALITGLTSADVTVFYDLYLRSPFNPDFAPDFDALGFGFSTRAPVSFGEVATPEPAGTWLVAGGLLLIAGARRCHALTRC